MLSTDAGKDLLGESEASGVRQHFMKQHLTSPYLKLDPRLKDEVQSPALFRSIQALFDLTWRNVITRDRRSDELPRRLEVVQVQRSVRPWINLG